MTLENQRALQIQSKLEDLVRREREVLNCILDLIIEAESTRCYLTLGYSSLHDWLIRHFKYSKSAAHRRINTACLKKAVPQIADKITKGSVTLSTASHAQTAIRAEEQRTKVKMSSEEKARVVEKIDGKTKEDTEKILIQEFPESKVFVKENVKAVSATEVRLQIVLDQDEYEIFQRARELISHSIPTGSPGKVIAAALKEFVQRKDPIIKAERAAKKKSEVARASEGAMAGVGTMAQENGTESAAAQSQSAPTSNEHADKKNHARSRNIPNGVRHQVFHRDEGRCQAAQPNTGEICGSRHQVEVDHILPWSEGGTHDLENLRCLCDKHNRIRSRQSMKYSYRW